MKIFTKSKMFVLSALVLATVLFSSCAESYQAYDDDYYGYGYSRPYYGGFGYYGFYPGYYYSPSYYGNYGWGGYYDYYPAYRYRRSNDRYVVRDRSNYNNNRNAVMPRGNGATVRGNAPQQRMVTPRTNNSGNYNVPQRSAAPPVRSYSAPSSGSSRMGMGSGSYGGGTRSMGGFSGGAPTRSRGHR